MAQDMTSGSEAGARRPACSKCVWEAVDAAEQGRHHDVEPLIQKALAIHAHTMEG